MEERDVLYEILKDIISETVETVQLLADDVEEYLDHAVITLEDAQKLKAAANKIVQACEKVEKRG